MARSFIATADSEFLGKEGAPSVSYPVTLACWSAEPTGATRTNQTFVLNDISSDWDGLSLIAAVTTSTDRARTQAMASDSVGDSTAESAWVAHTNFQWHHHVAIFAGTTDRRAYIDGGDKGTNATSRTPSTSNIDTYSIGTRRTQLQTPNSHNGLIAEVALWSVALSDEEVAELASGISAFMMRPESLLGYWPLNGRYGRD